MKSKEEQKQNPWNRAYELNKDKYTKEEIDEMLFCEITELLGDNIEWPYQPAEKDEINTWMGTSYHGDCFLATISELKKIFGPPDHIGGKIDKVQYEWLLDLEEDFYPIPALRVSNTLKTTTKITIYDWKEYRNYHNDDYIRFHIGGVSGKITELAKKEIEKVLTIYNTYQDE